jgi:hypothetical protein
MEKSGGSLEDEGYKKELDALEGYYAAQDEMRITGWPAFSRHGKTMLTWPPTITRLPRIRPILR